MGRRGLCAGVLGMAGLTALGLLVGGVMFWRNREAPPAHTWEFHTVRSAVFLPDGRLAVASTEQTTIYEFPERAEVRVLPDGGYLAAHPDGGMLAIGSHGSVRLYEGAQGALRGTLTCWPPDRYIYEMSLAFAPDGRALAVTEQFHQHGPVVQLWDTLTQERIGEVRIDDSDANVAGPLAFAPNGRWLVVATAPRGVWLIDVERLAVVQLLQRAPSQSLAFSPDGTLLSVGGPTVRTYATDTWQIIHEQTFGGRLVESVTSSWGMVVAISPDGRWLATPNRYPPSDSFTLLEEGPPRQTIALRRLDNGRRVRVLSGSPIRLHQLAFSPDGRWLMDVGLSTLRFWPVEK